MTIDLEELRQKAAFENLNESNTQEENTVNTAFLVVQDINGQWFAFHEYEGNEMVPQRPATIDDIVGGCAAVMAGCQIQQTAIATVSMMNQQMAAMQQRLAAQQDASRVASLIDPTKLRA